MVVQIPFELTNMVIVWQNGFQTAEEILFAAWGQISCLQGNSNFTSAIQILPGSFKSVAVSYLREGSTVLQR